MCTRTYINSNTLIRKKKQSTCKKEKYGIALKNDPLKKNHLEVWCFIFLVNVRRWNESPVKELIQRKKLIV